AGSREGAIWIAEQFRNPEAIDRAFDAAKTRCRDELREMSLTPDDVVLFNRLAGSVVFTNAQLRQLDAIAANRLGQPGLWPHSISGDLPIVLVHVAVAADELLVGQLLRWHAYTRRRGLELDLGILGPAARRAAGR